MRSSERTIEEKYQWLLSKMQLTNVSYWEHDALIEMENLYFQFDDLLVCMDNCVELAMGTEEVSERLKL